MTMVIKLQEKEGIKIARLAELSRFTLSITEEIKNELKPLLSIPKTKLILDLEDITFIDSSGIGCIISLVKTAKSNDSTFKICCLNKDVATVFDLLHLQMILDIYPDVEAGYSKFPGIKRGCSRTLFSFYYIRFVNQHPNVATITAFIVCIRFSASSKTMEFGDSKTSSVTSMPFNPNCF